MTYVRSPQADLHHRLSDALGAHDPDPDVYREIMNAYRDAGGDDATWADLPAHIQAKIVEVEQLPRTAWDDPSDVPDDTPDDF